MTKKNSIREIYKEWLAKRKEAERKEAFYQRLKNGKPRGRTRPPARMMTTDPGPH